MYDIGRNVTSVIFMETVKNSNASARKFGAVLYYVNTLLGTACLLYDK